MKPTYRNLALLLIGLSLFLQGFYFNDQPIMDSLKAERLTREAMKPYPLAVDLVNCPAWGFCAEKPKLSFSLAPQLTSQSGTAIHVQIGSQEKEFSGESVVLVMPLTTIEGVQISYWTSNALGTESDRRSFHMRSMLPDGEGGKYLFELLGSQWEMDAPGCAAVWKIFPAINTEDSGWMERIDFPLKLATYNPYSLLAGRLIWNGLVDAGSCNNQGLLPNGSADPCGERLAEPDVLLRQNENDSIISQAALNAYIPARLLKGLIAQESQFWPQWNIKGEYGLGMLTELGVDMTLMWNYGFFLEKCSSIYSESYCSKGYIFISDTAKKFLGGRVLTEIGTSDEYHLLAESLYASCLQSAQLVRNVTKKEPREVVSYENMWRISLGVYHAGCGCLYSAMQQSWENNIDLEWVNISRHLTGVCLTASDYFNKVIRFGEKPS